MDTSASSPQDPTLTLDEPVEIADSPLNQDAEAALEALRVAISTSHEDDLTASGPSRLHLGADTLASVSSSPAPQSSNNNEQNVEKALSTLSELNMSHSSLLETINTGNFSSSMAGDLQQLVNSNKRQAEIIKSLKKTLGGQDTGNVDPSLISGYVPANDYDELQSKYQALLSGKKGGPKGGNKEKKRRVKQKSQDVGALSGADLNGTDNEGGSNRKKRSMKLEHLIHQMANRRLGVKYRVLGFDTPGSDTLPDPNTVPPTKETSLAGIDELRPDYKAPLDSPGIVEFVQKVTDDAWEAWEGGIGDREPEIDRKKMEEAVTVYWTRLSKRYDEQQARIRGEVHKDELTRRKQNQYRRQQSLVARRQAAFDQSPLNLCKLRALYRTLLSIDFAPPTLERPDPNRSYSEDEWYAYQKLQGGMNSFDAHEIVDQWWLSANVRSLLNILDTFVLDQANRMKRKGKPKQPNPTFHLPTERWDRSSLPTLRPKNEDGLPQAESSGSILFRFHVDETVQNENPEWAEGLYDNPPIPESDAQLPSLIEIMNTGPYMHLLPRVQMKQNASKIRLLSEEEIQDVKSKPAPLIENAPRILGVDNAAMDLSMAEEFMSQNLESFVALANNPLTRSSSTPGPNNGSGSGGVATGPSAGSSVRARRVSKKLAGQMVGGAATPVLRKRKREDGDEEEFINPDLDIQQDIAFLQAV